MLLPFRVLPLIESTTNAVALALVLLLRHSTEIAYLATLPIHIAALLALPIPLRLRKHGSIYA